VKLSSLHLRFMVFSLSLLWACVVPDPPQHSGDFHSSPAIPRGVHIGTPPDAGSPAQDLPNEVEDLPEDTTQMSALYAYIEHAVLQSPLTGFNVGLGSTVATTDTNGLVLLVTEDSGEIQASGAKEGYLPHSFMAEYIGSGEGVVWPVIDTSNLAQLATQVGTDINGTRGHILVRFSTVENEPASGATLTASGEHSSVFAISAGTALPTDSVPSGGAMVLVVPNVLPGAVALNATANSGEPCHLASSGPTTANLVVHPATIHALGFICPD